MDTTPLARFIDSNNIRYSILTEITNAEFASSNIELVNLYIDMNSLFKILYGVGDHPIDDYSSLTASVVNICAHYRRFFATRYNVHTRIYIVNSQNCHRFNEQFVYEYNKKYKDSVKVNGMITDLIESNAGLLRTLVPYLPDVYFIDSTFETGVVMYNIMCRDDKENKKAHVILTKDAYNYQLVAMKPNTVILRKRDAEHAEYINARNLYSVYYRERKLKSTVPDMLSPELYSAMLALSSFGKRNIKTVTSVTKAAKVLEQAIKDHRLVNQYNSDIAYLWRSILLYGGIKSNEQDLMNRFKALDIQFLHSLFMVSPESDFSDRLVNLDDADGVRAINNEHFKNNPLDLNNL